MRARRFTPEGIELFQRYVLEARETTKRREIVPVFQQEILTDPKYTEAMPYELPVGEPGFHTKLDIGLFMTGVVPDSAHEDVRADGPFWTWLAARYFDQITANRSKVKEPRAYIAGISFQEFYRHLVLGPYYVYFMSRDDPERVRVLLYDDPTTMNEVMVQFGSYQTLMQNRELQAVIQSLYFDPSKQRIKRGAGGKGAGTPRRLMDFLRQIELNYDLGSIRATRFMDMLPKEFHKFREA